LPGHLNTAVGAGVGVSGAGVVAGGLDDVGIRSTIDKWSTTAGFHAGSDLTFSKDRGEISLGDIVNLLNARSAKVDAIKITGDKGGDCLDKLVDSQGAGSGLNARKGLGDAKLIVIRSIGETNTLSDSGINLLDDRGKGAGLGGADERLKVRGAACGDVRDNGSEVVVGARAACTETLQPGVNRGNDRTTASLQENLEKATRVEASGLRVGSNGDDGVLALTGDATGLSKCTANSRSNK